MSKSSILKSKNIAIKYLPLVALFMANMLSLSANVLAVEPQVRSLNDNILTTSARIARSVSQPSNSNNSNQIKSNDDESNSKMTSYNPVRTQGMTRTNYLLLKQKNRKEVNAVKKQIPMTQILNKTNDVNISSSNYSIDLNSFSIYRAFSYLVDDIDGDDFYQSFSIVFDVDIYPTDYAEVYAELYLRSDGGPWIHYYSSDIFSLYGDSEEDEFEVNTTLEQGYNEGFYDVLIEIYEVNSDKLVVSYSSDESNALYALALESSEFDQIYITEVDVIYSDGGSSSLLVLFILLALLIYRYKTQIKVAKYK